MQSKCLCNRPNRYKLNVNTNLLCRAEKKVVLWVRFSSSLSIFSQRPPTMQWILASMQALNFDLFSLFQSSCGIFSREKTEKNKRPNNKLEYTKSLSKFQVCVWSPFSFYCFSLLIVCKESQSKFKTLRLLPTTLSHRTV